MTGEEDGPVVNPRSYNAEKPQMGLTTEIRPS
jgi:hypothetical protein